MALFCDFENVALGVADAEYPKFDIRKVMERLLLKGSIVVKKAYCDWDRYKAFKRDMHEAAFELIEIPHVRQSGKNSADIRMVVDALDLCYTKSHVDCFVIISGDSDFSPLVSKLRENNKKVIGVGVRNSTSDLLIGNCDEFIFYDDLVLEFQEARRKRAERQGQQQPSGNARASKPAADKAEPQRAPAGKPAASAKTGSGKGEGRSRNRRGGRGKTELPPAAEPADLFDGIVPPTDDAGELTADMADAQLALPAAEVPSEAEAVPADVAADAPAEAAVAPVAEEAAPPAKPRRPARKRAGAKLSSADAPVAEAVVAVAEPAAAADDTEPEATTEPDAEPARPDVANAGWSRTGRGRGRAGAAAATDAVATEAVAEPEPAEPATPAPKARPARKSRSRKAAADVIETAPAETAPVEAAAPVPAEAPAPVQNVAAVHASEDELRRRQALDWVIETVEALLNERGAEEKIWGSMVKQTLKRRQPGFNEAAYGYRAFGDLLADAEKRGLLQLERDAKSGGSLIRLV
uniref:NYN domain-containing protein n=1 Tax=Derxia lacustris TaxID=764842 RepID=UPI000A174AD9